jgi:anthranilate phosphoribosyltransferase
LSPFATILGRVAAGEDLSREEMARAVDLMIEEGSGRGQGSGDERPTDAQIGLLLTSLRAKGETFAEVAGAAEALRRRMVRVRTRREGLIDTCGTGGDGSRTFNISTAAAIVTAAAGVPVAKHGNRSITSRTGSADVLSALGVNVEAPPARVEACLDELGIGFCFAPLMHPSMKAVAGIRKQLGVPTIFNLLGPLCNPAGAPYQVVGVGRPEVHRLMAEALSLLGTRRAIFVRGEDGLDEVSLAGITHVIEVCDGALRDFQWTPEDFGLRPADRMGMLVDGPEESAAVIRAVLAGERGPPRDIVLLNSAAALWTAGKISDLRQAVAQATEAIDDGAARELLSQWIARSRLGE